MRSEKKGIELRNKGRCKGIGGEGVESASFRRGSTGDYSRFTPDSSPLTYMFFFNHEEVSVL